MRTRPGRAEPEVYFRIVHAAQAAYQGAITDAYREQTVEIALGPKGAFEIGNIVAVRCRVPSNRVVRAGRPHGAKPPREPKTPRVVGLLRKAIEWRRQLDAGEVRNRAEIARREGITRARVTQVLGLLRLSPEIQEKILTSPDTLLCRHVTERMLRPIGAIVDLCDQVREFRRFLL